MKKYRKARIVSCSDNTSWYKDQIGKVIYVSELHWGSSDLEDKQGRSVLKYDIEYQKESL